VPFGNAVQSVLTNYVTFTGRARRSEYWYFFLFSAMVSVVTRIFDVVTGTPIVGVLVGVALLVPQIAVTVRRLHDTDRSAWWLCIALVPIAGLVVLLVFECQDSQPGDNRYGHSPKGIPADYFDVFGAHR
jgi:uncharacterized membrane protein YhaH (DUF805 family)